MSEPERAAASRPRSNGWRPSALLATSGGVHLAALATLAAAPRLWPWVAGTLATDYALIIASGLLPRCTWLGANLTHLPNGAGRDAVALTFDDGPDPEVTPRVLELLDAAGARASFFLIGERAARHPELVREIVARGHRVENHTYDHPLHFSLLGPRSQARQIDRAQELLTDLAGQAPRFLRAPAGLRNLWLDPLLHRRGLRLASWTRRGLDTADHDPRRVTRRLLNDLRPGDILLLHDGHAARTGGGRPMVTEVLPALLEAMGRNGWSGRPLPAQMPEAR